MSILDTLGLARFWAKTEGAFGVTVFGDVKAHTIAQCWVTPAQLPEFLQAVPKRAEKNDLPLMSLNAYSGEQTPAGSYRANAFVTKAYGVIGDYDEGVMPIERARDLLDNANIQALLYSTPSNGLHGHRWRVVAPFFEPVEFPAVGRPGRTAAENLVKSFTNRLNGALEGRLATESWTLSQAFFFGTVDYQKDYTVLSTFTGCSRRIDQANDVEGAEAFHAHRPVNELVTQYGSTEANALWRDVSTIVNRKGRRLEHGDGRRAVIRSYIAAVANMRIDGEPITLEGVLRLAGEFIDTWFAQPFTNIDQRDLVKLAQYFVKRTGDERAGLISKEDPGPVLTVDEMLELTKFERERAEIRRLEQGLDDAQGADEDKQAETPLLPFPAPFRGALEVATRWGLDRSHLVQPELTLMSALMGFATACGNGYAFRDGTRMNLYAIGVAPTATGKEKARTIAEEIAVASNASILYVGSAEGYDDMVAANPVSLMPIDEIGHVLAVTESKNASERARGMSAMLLKAFSESASMRVTRSLAKKPGVVVRNPAATMIGFTTPVMFYSAINSESVEAGLVGRLLVVDGISKPKRNEVIVEEDMPSVINSTIEEMKIFNRTGVGLNDITVPRMRVEFENDAERIAILHRYDAEAEKVDTSEPALSASLRRSAEKAIKIAGILAVLDTPSQPVVTQEHIEWAQQFVDASNSRVTKLIKEEMVENDDQRNAQKMQRSYDRELTKARASRDKEVKALAAEGWVAHWLVMRGANMKARDTADAVEYLVQRGRLDTHKVTLDGRLKPTLFYRLRTKTVI